MLRNIRPSVVFAAAFSVLLSALPADIARGDELDRYIRLLKDKDQYVRERAAGALGDQGDKRAVDPLIAVLKDKSADVRRAAVAALGELGDKKAVEAVIGALKDKAGPVRRSAADALGKLGDKRAVKPLIAAVKDDATAAASRRDHRSYARGNFTPWRRRGKEDSFQQVAAGAIVKIGQPAVEPLKTFLKGDDDRMKAFAVRTLIKLKWKPATDTERIYVLIETDKWDEIAGMGASAVKPLLAAAECEDYRRQNKAAKTLLKIRDKKALKPLTEVLKDKTRPESTRRLAISVLTEFGTDAADPLLAMLKDKQSDIRPLAAEALGRLGDKRAVQPLATLLTDSDREMRRAAARALSRLEWEPTNDVQKVNYMVAMRAWRAAAKVGPAAVEPLLAALKDAEPYSQEEIIRLLAVLADKRAVKPLIDMLSADDRDFRADAVKWIGKEATDPMIARAVKRLKENFRRTQAVIVAALGQLGDNRAFDPLMALLMDKAGSLRAPAAAALGRLGDKRAVKPLLAALNDPSAGVRRAAVGSLGQLGDERAFAPLAATLKNDKNSDVRFAVIGSLGDLGDKRAVKPLLAALKDRDDYVRRAAAEALGELGDHHAVEPILVLLENGDSFAIDVLAKLGDRRAVQPLIAIVRNERSRDRPDAIKALGRLGDRRAVEPLLEILRGRDSRLKALSARSLGKLRDKRAYQPLIDAMKDKRLDVRCSVIEALGETGDMRAVEPITVALTEGVIGQRFAAVKALLRLGGKQTVPPLVTALADGSTNDLAVKGLEKLAWKPTTDAERTHYYIAKKQTDRLLADWRTTKRVLLDDLRSGWVPAVDNAVGTLSKLGKKDDMVDELIELLNRHGNKAMAKIYLYDKNEKLRKSAQDWARRNGYRIGELKMEMTPAYDPGIEKFHPRRTGRPQLKQGR